MPGRFAAHRGVRLLPQTTRSLGLGATVQLGLETAGFALTVSRYDG